MLGDEDIIVNWLGELSVIARTLIRGRQEDQIQRGWKRLFTLKVEDGSMSQDRQEAPEAENTRKRTLP